MSVYVSISIYLNVSNIIVKSTNFPNKGTTREVGGIISASSRKNTVNERRILIDKPTWWKTYLSFDRNSNLEIINLFPAVWRKVKNEHSKERNAHTWYDKIHCVKKGLPSHCDVESNVQIRLITAGVEFHISEIYFI